LIEESGIPGDENEH